MADPGGDPAGPVLAAFDAGFDRLVARLTGLTDAEYHWEPAPGCWSVRRDADGRWRIDGNGGDRATAPHPDPPPLTTIAWRMGHIEMSFIGFGDRMFRTGAVTVDDVEIAGTASAATAGLQRCYRDWWRDDLARLDAVSWWQPIGPAFGPYAESTVLDLALHVLDELVHHAAEVALLRDLYRVRGPSAPDGAPSIGAPRP